ncbi:ATP-binding cassette domain-containing protein [Listeria kieliensis]|nr:ATP-binding cassette domain-containing protein [Listeria kieliensis]
MGSLVQLENVTKVIKGRTVLSQVTGTFGRNQITGIRGENGSGKTMLLRGISGLIKTDGRILFDGKEQLANGKFAQNMGILIERPGFLNEFTGYKNLELLALLDRKKREIGDEIKKTLELVGLDPNDKRKFGKYSLGMKQRLGIAQAIIFKPDVILLDEPTNAIDEGGVEELINLLLKLRQQETTLIVASHDSSFLQKIADVTFVMKNGVLSEGEA